MNWLDVSIVTIVLVSALVGVIRGFARESLALLGWVTSIWLALVVSPRLAEMTHKLITVDTLRYMLCFTFVFVVTLALAAVANHWLSGKVRKSSLNGTDRSLGVLFGVLRGVVLVVVLTWMAAFTTLPTSTSWKEASLVRHFESLSVWLSGYLPPTLANKLGY